MTKEIAKLTKRDGTIAPTNTNTYAVVLPDEDYTEEQIAEMEKHQEMIQLVKRIQEIKMQLQGMDYMTSKIIDGDYDDEEVDNIKATRKALRKEINSLENELIALGVALN